jgi:hypothetical protein
VENCSNIIVEKSLKRVLPIPFFSLIYDFLQCDNQIKRIRKQARTLERFYMYIRITRYNWYYGSSVKINQSKSGIHKIVFIKCNVVHTLDW